MIRNRAVLLAVFITALPRIIEALRQPQPLATNVTTTLTDGQGKPYTTHTGTTYQWPAEQVMVTGSAGSPIDLISELDSTSDGGGVCAGRR